MSKKAQELAVLVGWKYAKLHKDYPDKFDKPCWWSSDGVPYSERELPDYDTDLNAMRSVEMELERRGLHLEYGWELKQRTAWSVSDAELVFKIAAKTAEDRMDAAIKVLRNAQGSHTKHCASNFENREGFKWLCSCKGEAQEGE